MCLLYVFDKATLTKKKTKQNKKKNRFTVLHNLFLLRIYPHVQ